MASINLQGDTSGSISISAPSVAGSNTLTLPATTQTLATQNALGVRNLIINGDMRIDQRNAGASVTATTGNEYSIDRFQTVSSVSSKYTIQQSTTSPDDFVNSVVVTSSSAYSVGASEQFLLRHHVEGLNSAHLLWGTANAKTVTLSFWTRSSLTGTFGGSVFNYDGTRSYPFTYSISSADTWEQKTITIAGDTSGTWLTTNGVGLTISFGLGVGSTLSGTAGAWAGAYYSSATGATSVVGTSGATWYITGVQLEVGDTATPFEHRPYDMELARCQRYYQIPFGNGCIGHWDSSTQIWWGVRYYCEMRATPSVTLLNTALTIRHNGNKTSSGSAIYFTELSQTGASIAINGWTGGTTVQFAVLRTDKSAAFSAEL